MSFQGRPLTTPSGWTEEALREELLGYRWPGEEAWLHNGRALYAEDMRRFLYTLSLVPQASEGRLLEVGAWPYFTTLLLRRFRSYELALTNGVGEPGNRNEDVLIAPDGSQVVFNYSPFNVELDPLPFEAGDFDVVLCCEVLEHLRSDPFAALCRLNEALRPGGTLVLTTPNNARMHNVIDMIAGHDIHDRFSIDGPYDRHHREYVESEIRELFTAAGFQVDDYFTADILEDHFSLRGRLTRKLLQAGMSAIPGRKANLGYYMFVRASKTGEPVNQRPTALYRAHDPAKLNAEIAPNEPPLHW